MNCGNLESVKKLLEADNRPSVLNVQGYSPLTLAASRGHVQVASYLLRKGARLYETGSTNSLAFLSAANEGRADMVLFILRKEPSLIHSCTTKGNNALDLAAKLGHSSVVTILLAANSEIRENMLCSDAATRELISSANSDELRFLALLFDDVLSDGLIELYVKTQLEARSRLIEYIEPLRKEMNILCAELRAIRTIAPSARTEIQLAAIKNLSTEIGRLGAKVEKVYKLIQSLSPSLRLFPFLTGFMQKNPYYVSSVDKDSEEESSVSKMIPSARV